MSMIVVETEIKSQKLWIVPEHIVAIVENISMEKLQPNGFVTVYLDSGHSFTTERAKLESQLEQHAAGKSNRIS